MSAKAPRGPRRRAGVGGSVLIVRVRADVAGDLLPKFPADLVIRGLAVGSHEPGDGLESVLVGVGADIGAIRARLDLTDAAQGEVKLCLFGGLDERLDISDARGANSKELLVSLWRGKALERFRSELSRPELPADYLGDLLGMNNVRDVEGSSYRRTPGGGLTHEPDRTPRRGHAHEIRRDEAPHSQT